MAEPQKVYICDQCNRVVAKDGPDGKLILVELHHGGKNHQTTIRATKVPN